MFRLSRIHFLALAAACATSLPHAHAAVASMEDLSACKLPNDIAILPLPGTKQAEAGLVLKLSSGALVPFPSAANGQVLPTSQVLNNLRSAQTADLLFLPDGQGSLWVVSGRISELGAGFLSDLASRKFTAPIQIPATSRTPAGLFPAVAEGRVYLVQAADGHFALLRILDKSPTGLVIQYIYQPSGALVFDVPKADLLDYRRPASPADDAAATQPLAAVPTPAAPTPSPRGQGAPYPPADAAPSQAPAPLPPAPRLTLGPNDHVEAGVIILHSDSPDTPAAAAPAASLDAFSQQRAQLIQARLAIVAAPATSRDQIQRKTQAIFELANTLHADQAADLFVSQITFLNTGSTAAEFSQDATLPCFSALKHMGAPAAAAALKGLKQLNLDDPGDAIDTPKYRADLLEAVLRSIDGDDIANFILHREMEKETDPKKRAVFDYLLNKK